VEENFADEFIRLVKFYKGEDALAREDSPVMPESVSPDEQADDDFAEALGAGTAKQDVQARVMVGGRPNKVVFEAGGKEEVGIKDKIKTLTARQKGFLNDFLSLDSDGRDLVVDIGKNIISYLRQKGIEF
jgi:hypothetical protein